MTRRSRDKTLLAGNYLNANSEVDRMLDYNGCTYGCPIEVTLDVLGGKWKTVILARIKEGDNRFGALRRAIPQLSARVLTQRLRELEREGLLVRTVHNPDPPADIEYRLSARGESLRPVLNVLWEWGASAVSSAGGSGRG